MGRCQKHTDGGYAFLRGGVTNLGLGQSEFNKFEGRVDLFLEIYRIFGVHMIFSGGGGGGGRQTIVTKLKGDVLINFTAF